jgi:hypothetical protein
MATASDRIGSPDRLSSTLAGRLLVDLATPTGYLVDIKTSYMIGKSVACNGDPDLHILAAASLS